MNRFSTQQNGMTNSFFLNLAFIAFWKRALHIYVYICIYIYIHKQLIIEDSDAILTSNQAYISTGVLT